MSGFAKLLIANRGEIACRVIRTARAMGLRTVAVFSQADRGALHTRMADEAVEIGPAAPAQSYLSIERILDAAKRTGAEAIHPGYGFLSENAAFAEACIAAGLVWVGPPPAAIRAMGDKAASKRLMIEAGVPCLPGYQGEAQDDATLIAAAAEIGAPLMVKASAGGGGKGIRLVEDLADLPEALARARSEALKAFGSDVLILERAVIRPRHVEIQVFADAHGNVIHLGERDCSIQRRRQKVIEEAPSPAVSPEKRAEMGAAAVAAARRVGYVGAGTVEFLLAPDGAFYFLEMNTRLQVEHPVTEAVTGLDLVEWQLRVAAGERLPLSQEQVRIDGHAIEARLYAEAPHAEFLPRTGVLRAWEPPQGVRVDHGLSVGGEIGGDYDPMLAKVIAHGATREDARLKLAAAMRELVILGVETNHAFLCDVLDDEVFISGDVSTAFIEQRFPPERLEQRLPESAMVALAATLFAGGGKGWSSSGFFERSIVLGFGGKTETVRVSVDRAGAIQVVRGNVAHALILPAGTGEGEIRFICDGIEQTAFVLADEARLEIVLGAAQTVFEDVQRLPAKPGESADGAGAALSPMNGRVVSVNASPGQTVRRGETLAVVEAMKMEHQIRSPRDGVVTAVRVKAGDQVANRAVLVEVGDG